VPCLTAFGRLGGSKVLLTHPGESGQAQSQSSLEEALPLPLADSLLPKPLGIFRQGSVQAWIPAAKGSYSSNMFMMSFLSHPIADIGPGEQWRPPDSKMSELSNGLEGAGIDASRNPSAVSVKRAARSI